MNDHLDPEEPSDPELSRALRALAPESTSGDDAYSRALPSFVRARQRHRMMTVTASVTIAVAAVVGIALTSGAPATNGVRTVDPAGRTTTLPTPPTSSTTTAEQPADTTSTTAPSGGAGNPIGTSTTSPAPGSTTSTSPASGTRRETVNSAGGSIVVTLGPRNVTLVSESPAAGYSTDVRASGPSEVEVRFRMGSDGKTEHRIRLRFDSTGNLIKEIT